MTFCKYGVIMVLSTHSRQPAHMGGADAER